jgi:hypothetical protein
VHNNSNRLDQGMVVRHLNAQARVTLITTPCYSGGWTVSPLFNAYILAGATAADTSLSYPEATLNRCCGSPFISAVIEALIKLSIPGLRVGDEDDELNPQAFSYTALTKAVHDSYTDREGAPQTDPLQPAPTFAARDDLWGSVLNYRNPVAVLVAQLSCATASKSCICKLSALPV